MRKILPILTIVHAAFCLNIARAAPLLDFNLIPADGAQAGPAGALVGWGYSITNHTSDYLVPTAINSDPFAHATPLALFDFPVIAPNSTVFEAFIANTAGLFQLTWDDTAPTGFVNAGLFELSVDIYDGDPLSGGKPLTTTEDVFTPYAASVSDAPSLPLGLPSTLALLTTGWTAMGYASHFRRKKQDLQKNPSLPLTARRACLIMLPLLQNRRRNRS